jgi:hypothetical protein
MPVKDIGGGNVLVDLTKGDSLLETAQKQMGLVDLANRVRLGPIEQKTKEIELALKGNDLLMTDIQNETKRAQLVKAKNDEVRSQSEFMLKTFESLPGLINQSPDLANQFLGRVGGALSKNEKGGYTVAIPTPQGLKTFQGFEPGKVVDPKERKAAVDGWRKEYSQSSKEYQTVFENYTSMQTLSKLGTGAADIGIIFAYNKILDPTSRVTEGEVLTAQNAPSLPETLRNRYNKALTDGGPIFGPVGSSTRQQFLGAAQGIYETKRGNAARNAEFFGRTAAGSLGVDVTAPEVKAVVQPFGDVTYDSVFGATESVAGEPPPGAGTIPAAEKAPKAQRPGATEAGFLPTGTGSAPGETPKAKFKSTDDLLRNNLFKGLVPSGGRR